MNMKAKRIISSIVVLALVLVLIPVFISLWNQNKSRNPTGGLVSGDVFSQNKEITLGGQKFTISDVVVNSEGVQIMFADGPDNTAWLIDVVLQVETDEGRLYYEYDKEKGLKYAVDTIRGFSRPDGFNGVIISLQDPRYTESEHLKLTILGVALQDKEPQMIHIDFKTGEATALPPRRHLPILRAAGYRCVSDLPLYKSVSKFFPSPPFWGSI